MGDAYITGSGSYLPGQPVTNDEIVEFIGALDEKSERLGRFVLRQNGIKLRHYALRRDGTPTHSNASLAAQAVISALASADLSPADMDLLAAASTLGDLFVPGHASAVHAEVGCGPIEIASFQSVCASSMMALRTAALNIRTGDKRAAVAVGSELASLRFRPAFYLPAMQKLQDKQSRMAAEFLRWTLSDGAGAVLVEAAPRAPISLRIDHIIIKSFANQFDTCMYAGAPVGKASNLTGNWSSHAGGIAAAAEAGALILLQDMTLLKKMFEVWVNEFVATADTGYYDPKTVDWVICHFSAVSLRDEIMTMMRNAGIGIDAEKWFSNLTTCGNTGSAATFIALDAFMKSGLARRGDRIFCITPESGRSILCQMFLTVV